MTRSPRKLALPRTPKNVKPAYFSDPAIDKLLAVTLALAGELSVTRDRLDALERLMARSGQLDRAALDSLAFSETEQSERAESRAAFIARVLRVIEQELETAKQPDLRDFSAIVRLMQAGETPG